MQPGLARQTDGTIHLTLPADAENVTVARHVAGAFAEALRMPPAVVDDVRLAVTEACTNVVRHAYEQPGETFDVELRPAPDTLTVEVRDHGCGIGGRKSGSG